MLYRDVQKIIVSNSKPGEFFTTVAHDELVEFQNLESISPLEYDLDAHDFLIWDAMPWLASDAYKYVLFGIIYASYRQRITSGLCIDAIIDTLSGADQKSTDPNLWTGPFIERWAYFSVDECTIVDKWLTHIANSTSNTDVKISTNKAIQTIEKISNKLIGGVINL